MVKISYVGKLDNIGSWSLIAGVHCPGSKINGETVPVCRGCYAKCGNYAYPNVKNTRLHNAEDWKRDEWVDDMISELQNMRYFRWFDSGDIYTVELANKIFEVCKNTPHVSHWVPTKACNVAELKPIVDKLDTLSNVALRYSSPDIDGSYTEGLHGATVIPRHGFPVNEDVKICGAYLNENKKCSGCRACWDKSVKVIAYVAHGVSIKSVMKSKGLTYN